MLRDHILEPPAMSKEEEYINDLFYRKTELEFDIYVIKEQMQDEPDELYRQDMMERMQDKLDELDEINNSLSERGYAA